MGLESEQLSNIAMHKGTGDSGGNILRVAYLEVSGSLESQSEKEKKRICLRFHRLWSEIYRRCPFVSSPSL